jgi:ethanolamine utilization microcompartment shell protein EutL
LLPCNIFQGYFDAGFQCKNVLIHGSPALFYAMLNCSIEVFVALLDSGVSMEIVNNQGQTAILAAIQSRKENAINVNQHLQLYLKHAHIIF